jgi:hypothetical protein
VLYGAARSWDYDDGTAASGVTWNAIETSNWSGLTVAQRQADPGWYTMDSFMAAHAGKRHVITLSGCSKLHTANGSLNSPPTDLASGVTGSWYTFCTAIGTRYANQGVHYEIWNEPFATTSTGPFVNYGSAQTTYLGWGGTVAQLSTMITQAAAAIRAVDPTAKIIGPGFLNVLDRGSSTGYTYAKSVLSANTNAALTAVDYVAFHGYPINVGNSIPSPLSALGFLKGLRRMLTELGAPTKPLYLTEISSVNRNYSAIPTPDRVAFLQRTLVTVLCGDSNIYGMHWYGMDLIGTGLGWTQADADAWNAVVTYLTSGPVTNCTINQDGTVSVTVGATSRIY